MSDQRMETTRVSERKGLPITVTEVRLAADICEPYIAMLLRWAADEIDRLSDAATACEGCDGTGGPNKSCAGCAGTGRRPSNTTKKHLNFGVVKEVQSA